MSLLITFRFIFQKSFDFQNTIGLDNIVNHRRSQDIIGNDAIYLGDDWGQQRGLQMGPKLWREFIKPQLKRMYADMALENRALKDVIEKKL